MMKKYVVLTALIILSGEPVPLKSQSSDLPNLRRLDFLILDNLGPDIEFVSNIENASAIAVEDSFDNIVYLSADTNINPSEDFLVELWTCKPLEPYAYGSQSPVRRNKTISGVPAGDYFLCWYIDANNDIEESNENDNKYCINEPKIVIPPSLPDLVVTAIHVIDHEGPDISFKLTVKNDGTGTAGTSFKNIIYLSQDSTITDSDYRVNDWNIDQLAPGESRTSWDLASSVINVPAGEYYLGAIADAENDISESDETNNTKYADSQQVMIPESNIQPDICEGNMVDNGSFDHGLNGWQFSVMGSGNASSPVDNGVFHAQIISGGENRRDVSLIQYDFMIIQGNTYTVRFKAKAAEPRELGVAVGRAVNPFTLYNNSDRFHTLSTEWQTFSFAFIMQYPTDPETRLRFEMGNSDVDIYLDDICLTETASAADVKPGNRSQIATTFELYPNFPDPFNPSTTIRYRVSRPGHVTLTIYDVCGQEIMKLIDEIQMPGEYSQVWNAQGWPSGIYIVQLRAGHHFTGTEKLTLQK